MRKELQRLYHTVKGSPLFIIGGGNSFSKIDPSILDGKNVLTLNDAYLSLKNPTCQLWCDDSWLWNKVKSHRNMNHHDIMLKYYPDMPKVQIKKTRIDIRMLERAKASCGSLPIGWQKGEGLTDDVNFVKGNNSGAYGICLAANLCPSEIILLGYDMKHENGRSHYHDNHKIKVVPERVYSEKFVPGMAQIAKDAKNRGLKILNANPNSALKCFDFCNIDDHV